MIANIPFFLFSESTLALLAPFPQPDKDGVTASVRTWGVLFLPCQNISSYLAGDGLGARPQQWKLCEPALGVCWEPTS